MKINNNNLMFNLKTIKDIVGDFFYFPLWWYSVGLMNYAASCIIFFRNRGKKLSFSIWVKNIFVPMYGQNDWQGKFISFFVRLINIIFRGTVMIFWLTLIIISFLIWIFLPPFTLYKIFI